MRLGLISRTSYWCELGDAAMRARSFRGRHPGQDPSMSSQRLLSNLLPCWTRRYDGRKFETSHRQVGH